MPPKKKIKATSKIATTPSKAIALTTPQTSSPISSRKRKIDWATIDDKEPFQGFGLKHIKAAKSKKKQRTSNGTDGYKDAPLDAKILQKNPFAEGELSETHYLVEPTAEWESTQRYRKFTISDAEFEVGQVVFVAKTEEEQDTEDAIPNWVGRVLEVRAGDASHVYLRVYWLYRPEDLPRGRQPHHGDSELIASNHMDIIEALSVADRAEVVHWDEDPDADWPMRDQLFWRQTLDIEKPKAKQFSELRKFCVDEAPVNPDEPLINCTFCSGWLHAHCLEDQAVRDALDEHTPASKGKKGNGRKSSTGISFSAELTTIGPDNNLYLTVTDERPGKQLGSWTVDVKCLICHALIEKAATKEPLQSKSDSENKGTSKDTIAEVAEQDATASEDGHPAQDLEDALAIPSRITKSTIPPCDLPTSTTVPVDTVPPKTTRGRPPKRKRKNSAAAMEIQKTLEQAAVPGTATVFRSGIQSVKRLLWRGT